jgi:hypothetical protein
MKAWTVADLDARAREAVKAGTLPALSVDQNFWPNCHPGAGMKAARSYEDDIVMFTCATCNLYVCSLKIAKE